MVEDSDFFGLGGFLKRPFNAQGSALNWILFIGFLLCVLMFWNWILIKLARGVDAASE
jgi:hypothetical protein